MDNANLNLTDRLLEQRDLPIRVAWINNTAFSRVLGIKKNVTLDETEAWFKRNGSKTAYHADFVFEKDGKVRAFWGLIDRDYKARKAELYVFIYPSLVNLGIGIDVVESVCSYGIETLGSFEIYLNVAPGDLATIRACEKCGFHKEESRSFTYINDCLRYSLGMGEWANHLFETRPR